MKSLEEKIKRFTWRYETDLSSYYYMIDNDEILYSFTENDVLHFNLREILAHAWNGFISIDEQDEDEETINIFKKDYREMFTDLYLRFYYDDALKELYKFNDAKMMRFKKQVKRKIIENNYYAVIEIKYEMSEFMKEVLEKDLSKKDENRKVIKI